MHVSCDPADLPVLSEALDSSENERRAMRRTAKTLLAASKDRSLWTPKLRADAERVGRELLRRAKDR